MKILTTKGVGLIGSNLTKKLFRDNNEILIVDNLWRGKLENLNFNDNNVNSIYKKSL